MRSRNTGVTTPGEHAQRQGGKQTEATSEAAVERKTQIGTFITGSLLSRKMGTNSGLRIPREASGGGGKFRKHEGQIGVSVKRRCRLPYEAQRGYCTHQGNEVVAKRRGGIQSSVPTGVLRREGQNKMRWPRSGIEGGRGRVQPEPHNQQSAPRDDAGSVTPEGAGRGMRNSNVA